jgi:hypothetical protein
LGIRSERVIESCTTSASRDDSTRNSDCARSHRIAFSTSWRPPLGRPFAGFSSSTTLFSSAAVFRAAMSVASDERK